MTSKDLDVLVGEVFDGSGDWAEVTMDGMVVMGCLMEMGREGDGGMR